MNGLIFDEKTMYEGNIFKYEQRLQSHLNRYADTGSLLTTYFSQSQKDITVDRGTKSIDELFGRMSPLRFNMIYDMPINGFGQANPENTDELQVEDINVDGEATIIPGTVVPKVMDFFMINHLKMIAIFEVTDVVYDSMKVNGFYKIRYRLHSTSDETVENLKRQVTGTFHCDLNAIGSDVNPIIKEENFIKRGQIIQMVNHMIDLYKAMYYNERHNCFLFYDQQSGLNWFDMCGNEFMAKHGIMNAENSTRVVVLNKKIRDPNLPEYYANSVYSWLELGAPLRLLQKFPYILNYSDSYLDSSFNLWGEGDTQIMQPVHLSESKGNLQGLTVFDEITFSALSNPDLEPIANEFERLIWKYIHKGDSLSLEDVSLLMADPLISGAKRCLETYIYTPMVIYIIRQVLRMD